MFSKADESISRLTYYGGTGLANIMINDPGYAKFMLKLKTSDEENHAMRIGSNIESLVNYYFKELTGFEVEQQPRHVKGYLSDLKNFDVLCSVDGTFINQSGELCIVEYKTCFDTKWDRVNKNGADPRDYWQLQTYMTYPNVKWGYLVYYSNKMNSIPFLPKDPSEYMLVLKYKYDPMIEYKELLPKIQKFTDIMLEARGPSFENGPAENPNLLIDYVKGCKKSPQKEPSEDVSLIKDMLKAPEVINDLELKIMMDDYRQLELIKKEHKDEIDNIESQMDAIKEEIAEHLGDYAHRIYPDQYVKYEPTEKINVSKKRNARIYHCKSW